LYYPPGNIPPPPPPRPPQPSAEEEETARKAALVASVALLAVAALTTLAVIAWFARAAEPWSWKALVALLAAMLGVALSALVWRMPSRAHAIAGLAVMTLSLVRIGPPGDWTWVTFALLSVTILLAVPLVHAALVLR
jgi:hypothetical protein